MVKELVFHLGDPKTGSTSIQFALLEQGYAIDGKSIYYSARPNHIGIAKTLKDPHWMHKRTRAWQRLASKLDASDADYGIVSAEYFTSVEPQILMDAIREFLPGYLDRIRLIAYVRPHADRLVSAFAERTKVGVFSGNLEMMHKRLIREKRLLYTPRFQQWRDVFGDRFTLRPMVRSVLRDQDVVADFMAFVLGETPFALTARFQRNESLSLAELTAITALHGELRQAVNPTLTPDRRVHIQQTLALLFADTLAQIPRETMVKPQIHTALAQDVVATYRADAAALDAAFFDGTPMMDALVAAPGRAIPAPQSVRITDHYSPDAIRLIRASGQVLRHILEADPEHFKAAAMPADLRPQGWPFKRPLHNRLERIGPLRTALQYLRRKRMQKFQ